ncbi:hypothetical protein U14_02578 [Candidatus Moduliflexus flocculans]|uniref:Transposase n=1 Tax=Candidatus Moduliflexus flocculans TaxID=1499966 RepID=A0A081BLR9_9BACT|nr:hypothetical protein U14_02578 [Candidatus Moduliflexus flocculans]
MHLHANAKLTMKQRQETRRLHCEERISIRRLATQFQVTRATIEKWGRRESSHDKSSAPHHPRTVITDAYQSMVLVFDCPPSREVVSWSCHRNIRKNTLKHGGHLMTTLDVIRDGNPGILPLASRELVEGISLAASPDTVVSAVHHPSRLECPLPGRAISHPSADAHDIR